LSDANLGVNDAKKILFSVYPNPANDTLFFMTANEPLKKIQLYDITGKFILEENITGNFINVSRLQSGMYLIKAITASGKLATTKFIKQ